MDVWTRAETVSPVTRLQEATDASTLRLIHVRTHSAAMIISHRQHCGRRNESDGTILQNGGGREAE